MTPIKKACDTTYRATRTSGVRDPKTIKWVVVHDTEGGSAKSVALMFSSAVAVASTHLVVDEQECYRMLDNKDIPWGAPGANTAGFHIEHVGYAGWPREEWLKHDLTLRRGAYKAAIHMKAWGIPARWVGKWGLKLGRKGLTTHWDITQAFSNGQGHTDPGPNFPRDKYLTYVKQYLAEL